MSSLLAVSLLLGAAARVDSVQLSDTGARTAVRVDWTGAPADVTVHREGDVARVAMSDAELGLMFAGSSRFEWSSAMVPASAPFRSLRIESKNGEVFFFFQVSSDTPIDVRRGPKSMVVSFRHTGPPAGTLLASRRPSPTARPVAVATPGTEAPLRRATVTPPPAPPTMPPAPAPTVTAPPVAAPMAPPVREAKSTPPPAPSGLVAEVTPATLAVATTEPTKPVDLAAPPAADTAALHQLIFPVPAAEPAADEPEETGVPSTDLYTKLFPYAAEAAPAPTAATEAVSPAPEELAPGMHIGPVSVRPGVRVGYVDAQANFLSSPEPVRDQYVEFQPRLEADAPVGAGRLAFSYQPILRALGSFEVTRSNTHPLQLTLDAPLGTRGRLKLSDEFVSGVLETSEVDPGGEYFFDLGRFNKNALGANASIDVGPRVSLEVGGGFDWIDFTQPSSFFDYQRTFASVGFGFEATPTLKTIFGYAYDTSPASDGRPEAEYRAHSLQLSLLGDILPLVRGSLTLGYRDQESPNAAEGGTRFRGFTAAGTLTKDFGRESAVTLLVNRSTPLSNFQDNAYYVSTAVSASFLAPLPYSIALNAGGGYHWNDYPTFVTGTDRKREDRIYGWFVGLRRPIDRRISAFAGYRWERRRSNLKPFENDTDGFLLQLDVDVFGRPR